MNLNPFKKTEKEVPNSVVISNGAVEFDTIKDPPGFPSKCLNDDKDYYLLVKKDNVVTPLVLPDKTEYYNPQIYGSVVLVLTAHAKLFERRESLLQKIQPLLLVLGIFLGWLALVTVGGQ